MNAKRGAIKGYLFDLDGTFMSGGRLLPGAIKLWQFVGRQAAIVSNDTEHTPEQLGLILSQLGLSISPYRIVLAGTTALEMLARERPGAGLMLLGSVALSQFAATLDLNLSSPRPEFVFVARDRSFSYEKLAVAVCALAQGARLFAACPDVNHPGPNGLPVPDAGALVAAVAAGANVVPHRVFGKPGSDLFEIACSRRGVATHEALMVGDNPETDGAGAKGAAIHFWHAKPGGLEQLLANVQHAGLA